MDAAAQAAFLQQYGRTSDIPLGILRPVDTVPADAILLTVEGGRQSTCFIGGWR